jgi:hypothetical protein
MATDLLSELMQAHLAFRAARERLDKARVALRAFHAEYPAARLPELQGSWERELLMLEVEHDESTRFFNKCAEDLKAAKHLVHT